MLIKKVHLLAFLCLAVFSCDFHSIENNNYSSLCSTTFTNLFSTKTSKLNDALKNLQPKEGDSGLLLAFDTDISQDRLSYSQFYDAGKEFIDKNATNKTIYLIRKDNKIKLASKLSFIASPQKDGFLYLGMARYFEPKPRDKNKNLDRLEKEDKNGFKNFGFDYTRIWRTNSKSKISQSKKAVIKETKNKIDTEHQKLKLEDREYHRNITDYRKISFVSDGFYTIEGYYSLIHGGAAWFEGRDKIGIVSVSKEKISPKLKDYFTKTEIERGFKDIKEEFGEYRWTFSERIGYFKNSTFNFVRHKAKTHLLGLITIDGNAHRSFYAKADFGQAPKKFISYDNPNIDFEKFTKIYPTTIDVFVSPNQNTVFVLTDKKIIGIDVISKKEIYSQVHNLKFNKVIMVEWALNDFVKKWEKELNSN